MIKSFEASGKTVEEAIDNALALANTTIENVDIEVLELGGRGVFGLGKKDARVRVSLEVAEEKPRPVREKAAPPRREEAAPAPREAAPMRRETAPAPRAAAPAPREAADEAPQVTEMIRQRPAMETRAEGAGNRNRRRGKESADNARAGGQPEARKEGTPSSPAYQISAGGEAEALAGGARAFLNPIFASLKVQPQQEIQVKEGILWLVFSGPGLGSLIGRRGETLNALQYLTNLAVNKDRKEHARLVLDVEGYRAGREETLVALAKKMADKAVRSGRRVELEPMNPHERRIVHIALQNDKRVDTASQGEEPYRRVVINRRRQEGGQRSEQNKEHNNRKRSNPPRGPEGKSATPEQMSFSQQLGRQFSEQMEDRR